MTVSTTTNKISYTGNGVATSFAIPFPFLESGHLKAYQLLNNAQMLRTDWTVSDGNMIFATAPENNAQIVIMREVPLTQETDYRENEILSAETLERNFDKLTMQVQQLKEQADRAVTTDIFDDSDIKPTDLIPSIRQAEAVCTENATTARNKAQEAATSATNAAASEMHTAAMLETKANIDADNLSQQGKSTITALIPIDTTRWISNIFETVTTAMQTYTLPAHGYIHLENESTTPVFFSSNGVCWGTVGVAAGSERRYTSPLLKKGTVAYVQVGSGNVSLTSTVFIYATRG